MAPGSESATSAKTSANTSANAYKNANTTVQGNPLWFNLYHTTISDGRPSVCVSDPNTNTNGLNSSPHSFFVFLNQLNAGNA